MTLHVLHTKAEMAAVRGNGRDRAVVMTMGALHDGHAQLVREARALVGDDGQVVVTIFVNPTQFGPNEDFAKYPRTLEADLEVCAEAGADLVFAPSADEIYGADAAVTLDPGPLGSVLEGAVRPGHFSGVLTVVAKLMNIVAPTHALFGEKDYQQLTLIRRMVRDLDMPVIVVPVTTVREFDGLARSSRNRYLSKEERALAAVLPRALQATVERASVAGADAAIETGLGMLADAGITIDYLTITDARLAPIESGAGRVLAAVRIGATRLIDNMSCEVARP